MFKIEKDYVRFKNNHLLKYFALEELVEIANNKDLIEKARTIVFRVFDGITDKAGRLYINHLIRVSNSLDTDIEKASGLLHDIVEDTLVTFFDLIEIGFPIEIVEIVSIVTNDKSCSNLNRKEKLQLYWKKIDSIINSGNIKAINLK